jgi:LPXTG-motif cell wall-anchored protein
MRKIKIYRKKRILAVMLAVTIILGTFPRATLPVYAASGDVTGNTAFKVTPYDVSARVEIPFVADATNYKVYMSTTEGLTDFTEASCILNRDTYKSYAYAANGDKDVLTPENTISMSVNTTYYFYFVTNTGLQSTFEAQTKEKLGSYWTDPGNYDISWYGDGSAIEYNISTAKQLAGLAVLNNGLNDVKAVDFTGKTIKLTGSIDMSEYLWTPIGYNPKLFRGGFDGGNYTSDVYTHSNTIKGLHTNDVQGSMVGLFGFAYNSNIQNVGVVDSYIKGYSYIGGVVGCNHINSTITNVYSTGDVSGSCITGGVGGVVGANYGTATNSYNTGNVSGTGICRNIGGIVGINYGTATNSYNTGNVSGTREGNIGGIVGVNNAYSSVINCYNTGSVTGTERVGGVVGDNGGMVNNSYNKGTVSGTERVGGVVGYNQYEVINSYNTGTVSETGALSIIGNVGGVVGYNDELVKNSYNTGAVAGADGSNVGGVVGFNREKVTNTYNIGDVTGNRQVGGVVGYNGWRVKNSYNTGNVSGSSNVGGVVGYSYNDLGASASKNYYTGADFAFGGNTATNGTDSAGEGIPFVKTKDKVDINETAIVTEQTDVNAASNWDDDLGENFAVAYPATYTSLNPSIASVDTKTILGVATGNVNIAGTMTITQNELTDTGFDGATKTISVPIAMPIFVIASPTLTLSVAPTSGTVGTEITLKATLSNANNPTGRVTLKNGTTEIGNTTKIVGDVATFNYTSLAPETLNITAEYSGDESNKSATSDAMNYYVKGTQTGFDFSESVPRSKVYGDHDFNLEAIGGTGTGAVTYFSNDTSILTVTSSGVVTISSAGKATITATKAGDSNYNDISVTTKEITVNPINLNATITPNNKLYDGNTDATIKGEIIYNGIISGDEVSITGGTLKFTNKDAGTGKTVTASGYTLAGAKKSNYTLIQPSCTTADINKATLNVSINPVIINCGQDIPIPTVNVSGFKNGESESLAGFEKPTASLTYGSTTSPANDILNVIYTGGNATNNYEFSYKKTTTITINSDKTAPTSPTFKYTKKDDNKLSKIGNFLTFGIFWKEEINVEISSTDALSSVASIKYNIDGVDKTVNTTTGKIQFTVPLDFNGKISASATDNAGNISATVTSEGIILENEKPIITVETDLTNWKSTNFDVDIAVMDSKAGISKITYKINSDAVVIAFELSSETELVKAKDIQIPIATEGENIVIIEVTDNAGNTQTEIVVAKLDKIAPVIYEHATIVSGSNKDAVSVNIKRSTLDKEIGIIDTLIITIDSIKGLTDKIDPSAQSDARTVTINMPEPKDGTPKANQQAVEIPALAVQAMAEKNAILEIKIGDVKIEIDSAELKEINKSGIDLYFNVVPINDSLEKSKLSDRTKSNVDVIKIANELGNGGVVVQGIPYAVETNYSGFNTKLVIPFTGMTIPTENKNAFLDSLKVYIEHTDGTKEVKNGAIVYDNGNPIGIEITIDKFSSFQILSIDQSKSSSSIPKTGSRFDMMTLLILGGVLMLIGFGLLMVRRKRTNK